MPSSPSSGDRSDDLLGQKTGTLDTTGSRWSSSDSIGSCSPGGDGAAMGMLGKDIDGFVRWNSKASTCSSIRTFGRCLQENPEMPTAPSQVRSEIGCFEGCFPWFFSSPQLGSRLRSLGLGVSPLRSSGGGVEYSFDELEDIVLLGTGNFSSVTLVKCKISGQNLALKTVPKGCVNVGALQRSLSSEKAVLQHCSSPFVVQLAATFSFTSCACFLLEAALGGDLFAVCSRYSLYGSEAHAHFYTACILRALEHLHERCIIYRDLKLENVVLGTNGYAKLCDFGLSRFLTPEEDLRAYTICGTSEYMAPEVIMNSHGYSMAADWWSLGVLVHELMTAETPFGVGAPGLIFRKSLKGIEAASLPKEDWAEVVRGLCRLVPSERIPEQEQGIRCFEEQAWFGRRGFDWPALSGCSLQAPYIPAPVGPEQLLPCGTDQRNLSDTVLRKGHDSWSEWDADFEDRRGPWILKG